MKIFAGRVALFDDDPRILFEIASMGKTYVEIGTLFGGSACIAGMAGCEVFCIDPLDGYYSNKHGVESREDTGTGLVPTADIVRKNWTAHGLDPDKLHIFQQMHPPWPKELDRTFDVGLIDGDHTFEGAWTDYLGMRNRVKYLMLHDNDYETVDAVRIMIEANGLWDRYITDRETSFLVYRRRDCE